MLAALLALALAAAPAPAPAPPLEVLEAGAVDYDVATQRGVATGGVVLRRGAVLLRSETATYDTRTGDVDAAGSVLLTEPGRAVGATRMHAVLDGPYVAHDVVAFLKGTPLDLSTCRTLDEARGRGLNRLTLHGGEVSGESGAPSFEVEHARITLCDCGGGAPSWQIRAHHADVVPGKRAILTWPVIFITPRLPFVTLPSVPVLALPALYLPLGDRQTGLLFPELTYGGLGGFGVSQPLFITLGRSWDATVSAEWLLGPSASTISSQQRGLKGPGGALELRWAPAEGARGHLRFSLFHSEITEWPDGVYRPPGMNRFALSLAHDQRFSDATYLKLDVGLIGDPLYLYDFTGDALLRAAEYRRSALALTHRTGDVLLEADAAYHLPLNDLSSGCSGPSCARAPFGAFGSDVPVFHRLPAASATLLPLRLAGPLRLGGTVGVARFAPIHGATGDEGVLGFGPGERNWVPSAPDAGYHDGVWQPGERLAATRLLARAEASAPFTLRDVLSVEPFLVGTGAAYAFQAGPDPQANARLDGGVTLSTEIERTYGAGPSRWRHSIEPRFAWRAGTSQAGPALPAYAYDELDALAPLPAPAAGAVVPVRRTLSASPGAFDQLQLSVRNRLSIPSGPLALTTAELTLGQDLDLAGGRLAETWAQGALRTGPFAASGTARFLAFGAHRTPGTGSISSPAPPSSALDAFTELRLDTSVGDGRGDDLHASLVAIGTGGSPRLLAGLEPFFDLSPVALDVIGQGSIGARGHLSGASVGYDAYFNARELAQPYCAGHATAPHVYQHVASLVWDSPCKCWKAGVTFSKYECDPEPRFTFLIDLSSLAGGATGAPGH